MPIKKYLAFLLCTCMTIAAKLTPAFPQESRPPVGRPPESAEEIIVISGRTIFDGVHFHENQALLLMKGVIADIGDVDRLKERATKVISLPNATILPDFIELHAHSLIRNDPGDILLRHGVTTVRDVGGPLEPISGGTGKVRLLTAGPIITVQDGYPISTFGKGYIAESVGDPEQAKALVRRLVDGGAAVIKIALEPGGEPGAPWTQGHHGATPPPWPMASREIASAIVVEAHRLGKIVTAHVGENTGATIALAAGVDEWAHAPCLEIDDALIEQAAQKKVRVVTTLDTMSHCPGVIANARKLAKAGVSLLYGTEIAHADIPWGIDAQELQLMRHVAGMSLEEVLRAATSEAGQELGLEPLGRLAPGAPADLIAVRSDPEQNLKALEYPDFVMSGGVIVLDSFK
jgi:imidazolonepropionase-like amidohydrolase